MDKNLNDKIDGSLAATRAATYGVGLRSLLQTGTKVGALSSAKAIGTKIPVINAAAGVIEGGRLLTDPQLRAQRKQQLETNANASPLLSAGSGAVNPVGTLYGFGALLKDMFDSNASARESELAYKNALHKFIKKAP